MLFKLKTLNGNNEVTHCYFDSNKLKMFPTLGDYYTFIKQHPYKQHSPDKKLKSDIPFLLKIYLGNACNYNCTYCRQDSHTSKKHITEKQLNDLISDLNTIDLSKIHQIEFWGGEPLLYMEEIKYLMNNLKLPKDVIYKMVTNGSLITEEIADFILKHKFIIVFSHDGPGQKYRGEDPLTNPKIKELWQKIANELLPMNRFVISNIIHPQQHNLKEMIEYHTANFGDNFKFHKTEQIISYNKNCKEISEQYDDAFADEWLNQLCICGHDRINEYRDIYNNFLANIKDLDYDLNRYRYRCTMQQMFWICVDLERKVMPCQVYGDLDINLGNLKNYPNNIKNTLPRYMADNKKCDACIVAPLCKGVCPYIDNKQYFHQECSSKSKLYYALLRYFILRIFHLYILDYEIVKFKD